MIKSSCRYPVQGLFFMRSYSVILVLLFTLPTLSFELGDVSVVGNGCFGSGRLVQVNAEEGRYALPIRAKINKMPGILFERRACNLRLPVRMKPTEKLQLVNLSQVVRVVGYQGAEVKTSLSLGIAGQSGSPVSYALKITEKDSSVIENLKADGVIAESICGKDVMLTGNLSLLINGSSAQAFVSTGTALVSLKVVNCN